MAQHKPDYLQQHVYDNHTLYDNVRAAPEALVKAVLNISSTGFNNERQSFVKLSYSAIDNVLTNLLPAGLQDFFQVLNVSNATTTVYKLLECSPDRLQSRINHSGSPMPT